MCKSEIQKVDTKRKFVYNKLVDVGVKSIKNHADAWQIPVQVLILEPGII